MASRGKNLSDLKEGDEAIFVCVRDSGEERSVVVVEKVKPNRIHCGSARFDRETGLPVGSWRGDPSVQCRLQAATKQEIKAVLREHQPRPATLQESLARAILGRGSRAVVNRLSRLSLAAIHEMAEVFVGPTVQERVANTIAQAKPDEVLAKLGQMSVRTTHQLADAFGVKYELPKPRGVRRTDAEQPPG